MDDAEDRRAAAEYELALLERVAHWMDRRYIDPIIGFVVPGAGDVIGLMVGIFGIVVAFRLQAHPIVIARMFLNLSLDALVGAVPLLGDAFDFFYRAHMRNLELLRDREAYGTRASDWLWVGAAAIAFLLAVGLPVFLAVTLLNWIF